MRFDLDFVAAARRIELRLFNFPTLFNFRQIAARNGPNRGTEDLPQLIEWGAVQFPL